MNCLEYLLDLWYRGHRFTILYNGNHCIGVNDKKIFELGDTFKRDLLAGYSLAGGDTTSHNFDSLVRCFNLPPHYFIIAKEYYESVKAEV